MQNTSNIKVGHNLMTERFKLGAYVSLVLRRDNKILLIRRFNTGVDDGFYFSAGGKVDGNETITQAAIREAREELGISLKNENLKVVHVLHIKRQADLQELVGFYLEAIDWEGEPQNMEPDKHDDIGWFSMDNLPSNLNSAFVHVLEMLRTKVFFSEFGWE